MTFKDYWIRIFEAQDARELLKRSDIIEIRKKIVSLRNLINRNDIKDAAILYNRILQDPLQYELLRKYLASNDFEVKSFLDEIHPKILEYLKPRERGLAPVKKQEVDPTDLEILQRFSLLFAHEDIEAIADALHSMYDETPNDYKKFINFTKSYDRHLARKFINQIFPEVLKIYPELKVI